MSKHTPGPWMVSGTRGKLEGQAVHNIFHYAAYQKRDENIAAVWYDTKTGLGMADARLIAAAPELLEALQNMLMGPYHDCPAVNRRRADAIAAIAKATGETT